MREVPVSQFKSKCSSLLKEVSATKEALCITRFGDPIAIVLPAGRLQARADWIGCMKDSMQILGDIVSPATDVDEWEVLKD
jgi:prevent-host-death family protein